MFCQGWSKKEEPNADMTGRQVSFTLTALIKDQNKTGKTRNQTRPAQQVVRKFSASQTINYCILEDVELKTNPKRVSWVNKSCFVCL